MSMEPGLLSDEEMHAFIDGEVDPSRAAEIGALIARSPDLAHRVHRYRGDKALLTSVYGPLATQPLPEAIVRLCTEPPKSTMRRPPPRVAISLALAALVVLSVAGLALRERTGSDPLIVAAVAARSGETSAVSDLEGAALGTREDQSALLRRTLDQPIATPDLRRAGFELTRLTIYPESNGEAVQLSYRDKGGRRFTVYLRRSAGGDRFEVVPRGAERICIWQNADLSAVMVGEMSTSEMLRVASLAYADLSF